MEHGATAFALTLSFPGKVSASAFRRFSVSFSGPQQRDYCYPHMPGRRKLSFRKAPNPVMWAIRPPALPPPGFLPCECVTPGDLLPLRFLLASGEVINIALHPVELAGGFHRVNGVVVGCSGLYVFQSYAENRIGMAPI